MKENDCTKRSYSKISLYRGFHWLYPPSLGLLSPFHGLEAQETKRPWLWDGVEQYGWAHAALPLHREQGSTYLVEAEVNPAAFSLDREKIMSISLKKRDLFKENGTARWFSLGVTAPFPQKEWWSETGESLTQPASGVSHSLVEPKRILGSIGGERWGFWGFNLDGIAHVDFTSEQSLPGVGGPQSSQTLVSAKNPLQSIIFSFHLWGSPIPFVRDWVSVGLDGVGTLFQSEGALSPLRHGLNPEGPLDLLGAGYIEFFRNSYLKFRYCYFLGWRCDPALSATRRWSSIAHFFKPWDVEKQGFSVVLDLSPCQYHSTGSWVPSTFASLQAWEGLKVAAPLPSSSV